MTDDELPPERVDLWLLEAIRYATEAIGILESMTAVDPNVVDFDKAVSRLAKASDAAVRASHFLADAERRKGFAP